MARITPITQPLLAQDETDEQPKKPRETASEEQDQARVYPLRHSADAGSEIWTVHTAGALRQRFPENVSMESVLEECRSRVLLPRCGRCLGAFVRLCECDRPRITDVSLMITDQNTSRLQVVGGSKLSLAR